MCSNKSHIDFPEYENHNCNDAIVITFYVKHIAVIPDIICRIERSFDICKVLPFCL